MTSEHLRILLENVRDGHLFFLMVQQLAQAVVPEADEGLHCARPMLGYHSTGQRCSANSYSAVPTRPLPQGRM